jgi:hypothetical protein
MASCLSWKLLPPLPVPIVGDAIFPSKLDVFSKHDARLWSRRGGENLRLGAQFNASEGCAMSVFVIFIMLLVWSSPAQSHEFEMKVGRDTFVFDFNFDDRNIKVFEILEGEPHSDEVESLMHNWFAVDDIMTAVPEAFKQSAPGFQMGATGEIGANAFASIHNGKRYIVVGHLIHADYAKMTFVMGHELGHHVCGHTAATIQADPWADELEADTFAGLAVREVEKKGAGWGLNLQKALQYASELLSSTGSTSHPPLERRIQAILEGYRNGSPCVGRSIAPIARSEIGGSLRAAAPSWDHNGSSMRLVANGPSREFFYESPRSGLEAVGVQQGTLLFKGKKVGNTYSGTAYVFSPCGALPYAVSGAVSEDQRSVTMTGKAPIPRSNCSVARYRDDALVFTFRGE